MSLNPFEALGTLKHYVQLAEDVQHLKAVEHVGQYIELASQLSKQVHEAQDTIIEIERLFGLDIEEIRQKFGQHEEAKK